MEKIIVKYGYSDDGARFQEFLKHGGKVARGICCQDTGFIICWSRSIEYFEPIRYSKTSKWQSGGSSDCSYVEHLLFDGAFTSDDLSWYSVDEVQEGFPMIG